jgi:alginate O-acetyltransferase complex protein AlgI
VVFNSNVFLLFFLPVVFALYWLARSKQQRYVLLTVSGYVFYGYWDWRFCGLLLFSSLLSFCAGLLIERSDSRRTRRAVMATAISVDLTILGFFKYYGFLAHSLHAVAPSIPLPLLKIVLPIGISFYTFHTISYVVDVTLGRVRGTSNLFEYLAYVSLFSQLVAGPIVRFKQIEQDLEHLDRAPREEQMMTGVGFFIVGMIKKVILADSIAAIIDPVLVSYEKLDFAPAWACALGYTLQLYFDFSGYSDMATGLGHLFGIRIPQNFNAPYRAAGVRDFWRRWHISLSTWLRDYLYIPLGGNRRGPLRTHVNLMITMLLGGLWHGASWTFVAWGGYHGGLLVAEHFAEPWLDRLPMTVRRVGTFLLVVFGWVLFRSSSFGMAWTWLERMFGHGCHVGGVSFALFAWLACGLALVNLVPETWDIRFPTARRTAAVYAAALFACYLVMNGRSTVFLYYQF